MSDGFLKKLAGFSEILKSSEPLAPYTYLRLGGPAEILAQPRSPEELGRLVQVCTHEEIPLRILGGGCNLLIRDEGVEGVVLRLSEPAFTQVTVEDKLVHSGSGASLSAIISQSARHGLAGLEFLVGIPGTVGGALRHPVLERVSEISQYVRYLDVIDSEGQTHRRERDDLGLGYRTTNLDDPVIIAIALELEEDNADNIVKRMRKAWIQRKANQPLSFQAAVKAFKNPRGLQAGSLIEQAGFSGAKVGGAQISDRDPNYIIAHPGATSRDMHRLLELVKTQVKERFNTDLELEITIW